MKRLGRFVVDNSLTLAFLALLFGALLGQSLSGTADFNDQQVANGGEPVSWWVYVRSSSFAVDIAENWQSEYLQFALYIVATTWLVQRGSSESKKRSEIGTESDKKQKVGRFADENSPAWARTGGLRTALYGRSLGAIMTFFFLASVAAQAVAGRAAYNHEQLSNHSDPVTLAGYVVSADFWNRMLQNWQSEFLAVASMAAFAIYLRQRGSPESKLVGAPHDATALDG